MLIFAGFLTLSIWAYLLLGHGNFWRIDRSLPWPAQALSAPVSVVAVVPARNEADVVAECITSLLSQTIPIRVVLVDDNSTDGTAEVARHGAAGTLFSPQRPFPVSVSWGDLGGQALAAQAPLRLRPERDRTARSQSGQLGC